MKTLLTGSGGPIGSETKDSFDLAYSCGFIEHFSDYRAVIEKYWILVCPEDLMLLTVPVVTPVQRLIRLITYERSKIRQGLGMLQGILTVGKAVRYAKCVCIARYTDSDHGYIDVTPLSAICQ